MCMWVTELPTDSIAPLHTPISRLNCHLQSINTAWRHYGLSTYSCMCTLYNISYVLCQLLMTYIHIYCHCETTNLLLHLMVLWVHQWQGHQHPLVREEPYAVLLFPPCILHSDAMLANLPGCFINLSRYLQRAGSEPSCWHEHTGDQFDYTMHQLLQSILHTNCPNTAPWFSKTSRVVLSTVREHVMK